MNILDILAIIISFISLALSIGHIAYNLWLKRTRINILIDNTAYEAIRHFAVFQDENKIFVPCSFINKSHSDIAITEITVVLDSGYKCTAFVQEQFVFHNFWKSPDTGKLIEKLFYTVRFPINLLSLQGDYGILGFVLPKQDDYTFTDLIVKTNKKTLHLKEFAPLITEFTRESYSRNHERNNSENQCENAPAHS